MQEVPMRKQNRLEGYDYSACGLYFVTICTENRRNFFWKTTEGLTDLNQIELSNIGMAVEDGICRTNEIYDGISVDKYCIMPNHVHLLISIRQKKASIDLSKIINQLKGTVTKSVGRKLWQKGYYDHVIRNDEDLYSKWSYIEYNPLKFVLQKNNDG